MATQGVPLWSKTSATNSTADPAVNWSEGQAPSSVNDSGRAMMASVAKWRDDLYGLTTAGSATALTVTTNATYATATAMSGAIFTIIPHVTSGAAPTLSVDSLTARAINVSTGVAIPTGALKLGTPYLVKYVHATTQFIVLGVLSKTLLTSLDIITATSLANLQTDDTIPVYDVSNTENRRILVSDFFKVIEEFTALTTPDPAADSVLVYDASATAAKKVLLQNMPSQFPRGYKYGCTLSNNTTDPSNDINISSGVVRDSSDSVNIVVTGMVKRLDADWVAGTNAGMRHGGAGITNTTYHIFAIAKADGTQDIFARAALDPTVSLPTGYIYYRRIGSIIRSAGAIVAFSQKGSDFTLDTLTRSVDDTNPGTAVVTSTLDVPADINVAAVVDIILRQGGGDLTSTYMLVTATHEVNSAPTASLYDLSIANDDIAGRDAISRRVIRTNNSRQIRYRLSRSTSAMNVQIFTRGWYDYFED